MESELEHKIDEAPAAEAAGKSTEQAAVQPTAPPAPKRPAKARSTPKSRAKKARKAGGPPPARAGDRPTAGGARRTAAAIAPDALDESLATTTLASGYREGFARAADGTRIFFTVEGRGLPIVLVDGIGCDGFVWKYAATFLRDRCRVVHMHHRGHGRSETPVDLQRLSVPFLVEDLRAVLDESEIDSAVLMGHSMGVQVSLEFHHRYPERVQGLVLTCGSYGRPLASFHNTGIFEKVVPLIKQMMLRDPTPMRIFWRSVLPTKLAYQFAILFEVNHRLVHEKDLMYYLVHLGRMDPEVFFTMLDLISSHTAKDHLPNVNVPVLIIAGDRDMFTPLHLSETMHHMIPGSELLVLPSATHCGPIELPDLFNLRLEKFLTAHFGEKMSRPGRKG